jgi:hypothetical protein
MALARGETRSWAEETHVSQDSREKDALDLQLEFLKIELETVNSAIERIDGTTQATKNWAVGIWAGSMALLLDKDLPQYVGFSAVLPIVFWVVDAWWRRIQRSFIFRSNKISEFLNSDQLRESFAQRKLVGFTLLDPRGWQYAKSSEYWDFIRVRRTIWFKSVSVFYLGLMGLSLVVWLVVKP